MYRSTVSKKLFKFLATGLLFLAPFLSLAQAPHFDRYKILHSTTAKSEADYDIRYNLSATAPLPHTNDHFMRRTIYGFHPGWNGTTYRAYDFGILPTIAYYGYVINPATGGYNDLFFWKTTPLIELAHKNGSGVELVAAIGNAADCRRLLNNPAATNTLTDSLVHLIKLRDADGICLDFENLPANQAANFTALVRQIRDSLDHQRPKAAITLTLPANDPDNAFETKALRELVDRFIVKPYTQSTNLDLPFGEASLAQSEQALIHYQRKGLPKQQTLLAIPQSSSPYRGPKEPLSYSRHQQIKDGDGAGFGLHSPATIAPLLDLITNRNVQGAAIWALGDDHGFDEIHDLYKEKYSQSENESFGTSAVENDHGMLGPDGGATRERNANNWMWMLGGCVFFVIILFFVKRFT